MPQAARPFRSGPDDDQGRPARSQRSQLGQMLLNSHAWRRASKAYLAVNPMCAECERQGRATFATEVHHTVAHRGDTGIFWQEDLWESLCCSCHSKETAKGK